MLVGLSLIIGSACVFNNYIDRDIDKKMARTKKRATVTGEVSTLAVLLYGTILGILGSIILGVWTNYLTLAVALVGWFSYVVLYGYFKRRSTLGTVVGSISGAVPPVVGYCAFTDKLDGGALILFLILVFWQMPHFYAIAIYRLKDYAQAKIPVLPAKKGIKTTKIEMLLYLIGFVLAVATLKIFDYTGYTYLIVMLVLSLYWLWQGIGGFKTSDDNLWAKKMFFTSLIIISAFSVVLVLNPWLP
jgi:protoheme IX farnesyltransferase